MEAFNEMIKTMLNVEYRGKSGDMDITFSVKDFQQDGDHDGEMIFTTKWGPIKIKIKVFTNTNAPKVPNQFDFWFAGAEIQPQNAFVGGVGFGAINNGNPPDSIQIGGFYPEGSTKKSTVVPFTATLNKQ